MVMTINPDNDLRELHSFKIINSTYLALKSEYKYDQTTVFNRILQNDKNYWISSYNINKNILFIFIYNINDII